MKIIMLTSGQLIPKKNAPEIGGAARQCLKLSKELVRKNIPVTVVTKSFSPGKTIKTTIDGVPVVFLNTYHNFFNRKGLRRFGIWAFIACAFLYLYKNKNEYDIIHAHSALISGFIAVLAGKITKKKSIIKVMNSGYRNDILRFKADKTIIGSQFMANYLNNCDRAITLNSLAYNELLQIGFRATQLELIYNGVKVNGIPVKKKYSKAGTIKIAYLGRLTKTKELDTLIHAIYILVNKYSFSNCHLNIAGKGPLYHSLKDKVDYLTLKEFVSFLGEVNGVEKYLLNSDIFVLPSSAEGISNALLEAMAIGLPCIASDIAGNRHVINNGHNGLLFELNKAQDLAKAIKSLSENDTLCSQLGRNARLMVQKNFNIIKIADQYIQLYNYITDEKYEVNRAS
jgi:glycosyltransferase involved in cell wall biosynthesis